jgi:H+/Cl- antiporter ClcA
VIANALSDRARLSDEQRKLLVACGAGAGMAAAYGVPLGGALFAVEVLRGVLALRLVLPALLASATATAVSWLVLPNAPTYLIPAYPTSPSVVLWALLAGPVAGLVSVGYVWLIAWADRNKPKGWRRLVAPILLTIELTGRDRSFILPLLLAVVTATVVARTLDRRSIYDARLTDKEVKNLQAARAPSPS